MNLRKLVIGASLGTLVVFASLSPAGAQGKPRPDYYKGKTLVVVVPNQAGAGTDISARLVAKHLGKYIPGKPVVIVRNMPGAAGNIAANYVYASAKRDGLTAFMVTGLTCMASWLRPKGTKFSLDNMPCTMAFPNGEVIYARREVLPKAEDIMTRGKDLIWGYAPMPSSMVFPFMLGKKLLGFQTKKDVQAFTGGADSRRAIMGGEIDITGESTFGYSTMVMQYEKEGKITPIWQSGLFNEKGELVREETVSHIQTFKELYEKIKGKPPSGPPWDAFEAYVAYARTIGKALFFPPETEEYAAIIRKAGVAMSKDPAFLKDADPLVGGSPMYFGETIEKVIKDATPRAIKVRAWAREWIRTEYDVDLEN